VDYFRHIRIALSTPRCGDQEHPSPAGDANKDCKVDMDDLNIMGAEWLTDSF
jgi:hypothetical protein